jgi:integrase
MSTPTGIRRTPQGWQAFIRVRGRFHSKRYPSDASLTAMKRWREEIRVRSRLGAALPDPNGSTLAQDVRFYLEQIETMPTKKERARDLALWIAALGPDRDRQTITAGEIRAQLELWRTKGPRCVQIRGKWIPRPGPLSAQTVNHRRTALMALYTALDGRSARNPARDVDRYQGADDEPRALPLDLVDSALGALKPSKGRARLKLLRWTGWPHKQIGQLKAEHINWKAREVHITSRRKGKGWTERVLPVLPQALEALREFDRADAYGEFSASSLRQLWRRALGTVEQRAKAGKLKLSPLALTWLPKARVYDLRHTFGTMLALRTPNRQAQRELMLHSDERQIDRYTRAAADPVTRAALQEVARRLPRTKKSKKQARKRP